jgi:hypothetical protein
MRRILTNILLVLTLSLSPSLLLAGSAYAAPATCGSNSDAKGQILNGIGETTTNCSDTGVKNLLASIVNILSLIVGVVVVISIISAGFKYITSGGEASKVANAKSTIIYALVGLVIVVLAQFIVRVVVHEAAQAVANNATPPIANNGHRTP